MNGPGEQKPGFLDILIWRLIVFICLMSVFLLSWPIYQKMNDAGFFPEPRIEITGFQPNEQVVIRRFSAFHETELETKADESGKAIFNNASPGNWKVTKGGTEKLRSTTIYIPDRHAIFTKQIDQFEIKTIFQRGS